LLRCGSAGSVKGARNSYAYRGKFCARNAPNGKAAYPRDGFKSPKPRWRGPLREASNFRGARGKTYILHNKPPLSVVVCNVVSFESVFDTQIIEKRDRRHEHS
jgi:hypothetical protein